MDDLPINWNDMESNTINAMKYACQQLRLHPNGGKKKDYIRVLNNYKKNELKEKKTIMIDTIDGGKSEERQSKDLDEEAGCRQMEKGLIKDTVVSNRSRTPLPLVPISEAKSSGERKKYLFILSIILVVLLILFLFML